MPLRLALLSPAFPPEKQGAVIGIFSAITRLVVAHGPLVSRAVVRCPPRGCAGAITVFSSLLITGIPQVAEA